MAYLWLHRAQYHLLDKSAVGEAVRKASRSEDEPSILVQTQESIVNMTPALHLPYVRDTEFIAGNYGYWLECVKQREHLTPLGEFIATNKVN